MDLNYRTNRLFPICVHSLTVDNFDKIQDVLIKESYDLRKIDPVGRQLSNRGGWHSKNFKLNDKNSVQFRFALELQKYILDVFQKYGWQTEQKNIQIKEMWAIINKKLIVDQKCRESLMSLESPS